MEERITKRQLEKIYGVNRSTIENWIREKGLPIIEISSHKKFIRKNDLIEFENKMIKNKGLSGILEG